MSAKIILDTENPIFIERVLTMELEFPKFILAEFSKHRNISFNTSSSRAIPVSKMLETIEEYPVNFQWTKKGPGMSGERLDKDSPTFKNADDIAMEIKNFLIKNAYITPQGTSSMNYPVKNLRLYSGKKNDAGEYYSRMFVGSQIFIDGREINATEIQGGIKWYHAKAGEVGLEEMPASSPQYIRGEVYIATWNHPVKAKSLITIRPDSFPGTYYVTGDTMIRSERTGKDEYFQFIIPKAKMTAEQTISLEAEGDPTTFNMSLQVLRPESGEMLQFVKYEFFDDDDTDTSNNSSTGANDGWKDKAKLS